MEFDRLELGDHGPLWSAPHQRRRCASSPQGRRSFGSREGRARSTSQVLCWEKDMKLAVFNNNALRSSKTNYVLT